MYRARCFRNVLVSIQTSIVIDVLHSCSSSLSKCKLHLHKMLFATSLVIPVCKGITNNELQCIDFLNVFNFFFLFYDLINWPCVLVMDFNMSCNNNENKQA